MAEVSMGLQKDDRHFFSFIRRINKTIVMIGIIYDYVWSYIVPSILSLVYPRMGQRCNAGISYLKI